MGYGVWHSVMRAADGGAPSIQCPQDPAHSWIQKDIYRNCKALEPRRGVYGVKVQVLIALDYQRDQKKSRFMGVTI